MRLNKGSSNVSTKAPSDNRVAIAFSPERNSGIGNGQIVNVASIGAHHVARTGAVYCPMKYPCGLSRMALGGEH